MNILDHFKSLLFGIYTFQIKTGTGGLYIYDMCFVNKTARQQFCLGKCNTAHPHPPCTYEHAFPQFCVLTFLGGILKVESHI